MHYELFKRFLNSVKEILALVVVCVRKGAFKLFKQVFLLLGKVLRNFDIDVNILVAAVGAVDLLHALALETECCAVLRSLGDSIFYLAVDSRNDDLIAENCLHVCDRYIGMDIVAVTLEYRIGTNIYKYMKIAVRTAVHTCVALTSYLHCLTVINTRNDIDGYLSRNVHSAVASALGTRIGDDLALASALCTRLLRGYHAERSSLCDLDLTCAVTVGAGFR